MQAAGASRHASLTLRPLGLRLYEATYRALALVLPRLHEATLKQRDVCNWLTLRHVQPIGIQAAPDHRYCQRFNISVVVKPAACVCEALHELRARIGCQDRSGFARVRVADGHSDTPWIESEVRETSWHGAPGKSLERSRPCASQHTQQICGT